jgi:predicted DNA-binding transcriptional regulator AlpA
MSRVFEPAFPRAVEQSPADEELIDVAAAAEILCVPASWVYQHARPKSDRLADPLPYHKVGRYTRFYESELRAWLVRHQGGARR